MNIEIQIASMNDALKNSIWNFIRGVLPDPSFARPLREAVTMITDQVLKRPVDEIHVTHQGGPRDWLFKQYRAMGWAEVYDVLEFVVQNVRDVSVQADPRVVAVEANNILARERSAYRFVAGELTQITAPAEIAEVERAAESTAVKGLDGAREHLKQALSLYGKRPDPDYRNAIKEAISAVESVVKVINGKRGGGLHEALEAVSGRIELHPALKTGLEKLYAYTSDKDGVRHAIYGDDAAAVDETDARFMIVTCSAFVNFLISKAEAAGLLKSR